MPLAGALHLILDAIYTGPGIAGAVALKSLYSLDKHYPIGNGTDLDQADLIFSKRDTIGPSGTKTWDVRGAQIDDFGVTLNMVEVCGVIVIADAANTNNVEVGNALNALALFKNAAHVCPVQPGATFMKMCMSATGLATAMPAGSDDILITNSGAGTSVTYQIYIIGRSA